MALAIGSQTIALPAYDFRVSGADPGFIGEHLI